VEAVLSTPHTGVTFTQMPIGCEPDQGDLAEYTSLLRRPATAMRNYSSVTRLRCRGNVVVTYTRGAP
jgi:hypothetical protein